MYIIILKNTVYRSSFPKRLAQVLKVLHKYFAHSQYTNFSLIANSLQALRSEELLGMHLNLKETIQTTYYILISHRKAD